MTDREKLIALIQASVNGCDTYWAERIADHLIANGVVVREKGEWVGWHGDRLVGEDEYGMNIYRHYHYHSCRKCGRRTAVRENFCPNCGADMRKGENDG